MEYTKQSIAIEQLASGRPLQGRCSHTCVPSEGARYARTPGYRAVTALRSAINIQRDTKITLQSLGSEQRNAVAILRSLGSESRDAVAILRSLGSERQEIVTAFHSFGIGLRRNRTVKPSTLSNRGYDRREHPRTATVNNYSKHPEGVPHHQQTY